MNELAFGEDEIIQLSAYALLAAHLVVLVWYWLRRNLTAVVALNILTSGGVLGYWAPRLDQLWGYIDEVVLFVSFEAIVFALSVAPVAGARIPRALMLIALVINLILSASAVYFFLTFKITRLF